MDVQKMIQDWRLDMDERQHQARAQARAKARKRNPERQPPNREIQDCQAKKEIQKEQGEIRYCSVCMSYKRSTMAELKCSHVFCRQCFTSHAKEQMKQWKEIKCLEENCSHIISPYDPILQKFLSRLQQRKYTRICRFAVTLKDSSLKLCPNQECEGFLNVKFLPVVCSFCANSFCGFCLMPQHKGACQKIEEYHLKDNLLFKKCARCSRYIEKNQGCNYLKCLCSYQFCFICERQWEPEHLCPKEQQHIPSKRTVSNRRKQAKTNKVLLQNAIDQFHQLRRINKTKYKRDIMAKLDIFPDKTFNLIIFESSQLDRFLKNDESTGINIKSDKIDAIFRHPSEFFSDSHIPQLKPKRQVVDQQKGEKKQVPPPAAEPIKKDNNIPAEYWAVQKQLTGSQRQSKQKQRRISQRRTVSKQFERHVEKITNINMPQIAHESAHRFSEDLMQQNQANSMPQNHDQASEVKPEKKILTEDEIIQQYSWIFLSLPSLTYVKQDRKKVQEGPLSYQEKACLITLIFLTFPLEIVLKIIEMTIVLLLVIFLPSFAQGYSSFYYDYSFGMKIGLNIFLYLFCVCKHIYQKSKRSIGAVSMSEYNWWVLATIILNRCSN